MGLADNFDQEQTTSSRNSRDLVTAINKLDQSINKMLKVFDEANAELSDAQERHDDMKQKMDEISDQNSKIAEGIVSLADMLKKPQDDDGSLATPSPDEDRHSFDQQSSDNSFMNDSSLPELERAPGPHQFDMGYNDHDLQEASFNNKSGIDLPSPEQPAPQQGSTQKQEQNQAPQDLSNFDDKDAFPRFDSPEDPFAPKDPFAQQSSGQEALSADQSRDQGFPTPPGFDPQEDSGTFPPPPRFGSEEPAPQGSPQGQGFPEPSQQPRFQQSRQPSPQQPSPSRDAYPQSGQSPFPQPPQGFQESPQQQQQPRQQSRQQSPFPGSGQDRGPNPSSDSFSDLDVPPAPEPPKKKGLFARLKK